MVDNNPTGGKAAGRWQFSGSTGPNQEIPLGQLVDHLAGKFSGSEAKLPTALDGLVIENLHLTFDTGTKDFTFSGEGKFWIAKDQGKAVDLLLDIALKHMDGSYQNAFGGRLIIDLAGDQPPAGQSETAQASDGLESLEPALWVEQDGKGPAAHLKGGHVTIDNASNEDDDTLKPTQNYDLYVLGKEDLLFLQSSSGGKGNKVHLDMQTYLSKDKTPHPTARISAIDDGNFSSHIVFSTKTPGQDDNSLVERLRITSDGNVGIGTTDPKSKLDVRGTVTIDGVTGAQNALHIKASTDATYSALWVKQNGKGPAAHFEGQVLIETLKLTNKPFVLKQYKISRQNFTFDTQMSTTDYPLAFIAGGTADNFSQDDKRWLYIYEWTDTKTWWVTAAWIGPDESNWRIKVLFANNAYYTGLIDVTEEEVPKTIKDW